MVSTISSIFHEYLIYQLFIDDVIELTAATVRDPGEVLRARPSEAGLLLAIQIHGGKLLRQHALSSP
jgi:hypothetical protein